MKFIILFLIMVLIISTIAKLKYAKELGLTNTNSFVKMLILPTVLAIIAIGFIIYFS